MNLGERFSNLLCDRLIKTLQREGAYTKYSEAEFCTWISLLILAFYRAPNFQSIPKPLVVSKHSKAISSISLDPHNNLPI